MSVSGKTLPVQLTAQHVRERSYIDRRAIDVRPGEDDPERPVRFPTVLACLAPCERTFRYLAGPPSPTTTNGAQK